MTVSFTQFISFLFIALFTSLLYISSCFYLTLFPFYFTLLRAIHPLSGIEILDAYISTFR
ncbi:hypothetical protein Peur_072317 [Populus x canadensis]